MKRLVVVALILLGTLALTLGACGSDEDQTLEGTRWVLTSYAAQDGSMMETIAAVESDALFADGKIEGNGGVNTYNGTYQLDGDKLTVSPLMTTLMAGDQAAMEQEDAFLAALQSAASYSVEGDRLLLKDGGGNTSLEFQAAAE